MMSESDLLFFTCDLMTYILRPGSRITIAADQAWRHISVLIYNVTVEVSILKMTTLRLGELTLTMMITFMKLIFFGLS